MKFIESVAVWHTKKENTTDFKSIYAFDLDQTLIYPKSGAKFARSASDWKWQTENTKTLLQKASLSGTIVIFTNQGGVIPDRTKKSFQNLDGRIQLVLKDLGLPNVRVYAACKNPANPKYRKPATGMWDLLVEDLSVTPELDDSFFVGDAAGRKGDHSDCDLKFAQAVGLKFLLPEEFEVFETPAKLPEALAESTDLKQEVKQEHDVEDGPTAAIKHESPKHTVKTPRGDADDVLESAAKKQKKEAA